MSVETGGGHPQADAGFLAAGDGDRTVGGEIESVRVGEDGEGCGRRLLIVVGEVGVLVAQKGVLTSPFSPPHAACNTTQHTMLRIISRFLLWVLEAILYYVSD